MKRAFISIFLTTFFLTSYCRENALILNDSMKSGETAKWISCPHADLKGYGVYHFRKVIEIKSRPKKFIVYLSADNRYRLYVNGTPVCFGPARGDLGHWYYDIVDLSVYLKEGKNVLAATVWNFGTHRPEAQVSKMTAFMCQGKSDLEKVSNTDTSWRVMKDESYTPINPDGAKLNAYIVIGPGEEVNGELFPWNWQNSTYKEDNWSNALILEPVRLGALLTDSTWNLIPRDIPFMEEKIQKFAAIRRKVGIIASESFLEGKERLEIPANSKVSFLLDQGVETVAYPEILVSGSKGSALELIYAESLVDKERNKGSRNSIAEKNIIGVSDNFHVGSFNNELFRPLWCRAFRYIQVNIKTGDFPLEIKEIHSVSTTYPYEENASFNCNDDDLNKIFEVGWQTVRLCSNETYFDCPYYEQLQYVGDARIESLISCYVSGDNRLMKKALLSFDHSRMKDGLTCSRFPSIGKQLIPPYSLLWINMIHDYWMMYKDTSFVKPLMKGIEGVISWYENHLNGQTGMLGTMPDWNFVDWTKQWTGNGDPDRRGVPPGGAEGGSSVLSLQFAYALHEASELFQAYGNSDRALKYKEMSQNISKSTVKWCWDSTRNLLSDTPDKVSFSQHANIMAILANAELPVAYNALMNNVLVDKSLVQASLYYQFYLFRALNIAGLGDKYVDMLNPWKKMLKLGLSTFAETVEPSRSDCHGWSASPTYDLLATVCGILPGKAGFQSVLIAPHLGSLVWVEGSVANPQGNIKVKFNQFADGSIQGEIFLPGNLNGKFIYRDKIIELHPGKNVI